MSGGPETPLWQELRDRAEQCGVLAIELRDASSPGQPRVVELTWPGEIETLRFRTGDDLDGLAHALARELGIALGAPPPPDGPAAGSSSKSPVR